MNFSILFMIILSIGASNGYKILFLTPFPIESHWTFMQSIIKALASRNHEVTVITSLTWNGEKPDGYTEVLVDPPYDLKKEYTQSKIFKIEDWFDSTILNEFKETCVAISDHALKSSNVQKLIHNKQLTFDVIVFEDISMESFLMFSHLFKAPYVSISTSAYSDLFDSDRGLLTPWSHVPFALSTYSDNMDIFQRINTIIFAMKSYFSHHVFHIPKHNELAKKYFGHLGELPCVGELRKNVSATLVNTHHHILMPRPAMPGIALIAGAHIEEPNPLPNHLQEFLDGATNGAIFFSFGPFIRSSEMPADKLKMFIDTFKQINLRVLCIYDDDTIYDLPENVMIQKWVPQTDVLAHPNIILFINHGGQFSVIESIYRAVPMIIIPLSGDQFSNAAKGERFGYATAINFNDLSTNLLVSAITNMTTNLYYPIRAKETSELFRDYMVHPMDKAMWWIEHVAKFHGTKYLQSYAVYMSWYSYLSLDVIAALIANISFFLYIIIKGYNTVVN